MATPGEREARYRAAEAALWRSLGVAPTERRVSLPRLGTDVRVQELGDGPPVLFVHGASTAGTSWASLAALLPSFRCLLLDRPGTGLSAPLAPPIKSPAHLVDYADRLVADVLDALAIDRADLVTTSFGGYFGFRFALASPGRVGRIVSLGWTAGAPPGQLPLVMRLGSTPPLGGLLARMPANDATVRRLWRGIGLKEAVDAGRVTDEAVASYVELLRDTDTMRNEVPLGGVFFAGGKITDSRLVLSDDDRARIRAPILFLWGETDPFGGADIARAFVAGFPDARLELIAGVGHAPWMDDAPAIATRVAAFLDRPVAAVRAP